MGCLERQARAPANGENRRESLVDLVGGVGYNGLLVGGKAGQSDL